MTSHMILSQRFMNHGFAGIWQPIAQLEDKYATNLLLCAPELVDADCNPAGIGMGYWQDDRDDPGPVHPYDKEISPPRDEKKDYGGFLAC